MWKYVWVLFILVACFNLVLFSWTARQALCRRPELAAGFRKLLLGYALVLNLPWVVMGVGCLASDITVWHYLAGREGKPFVLAWWGCLVLLWLVGFYWLFFRRGAEFLVEHRDLWGAWKNRMPLTPGRLKLLYVASVLGGLGALGVAFSGAVSVP